MGNFERNSVPKNQKANSKPEAVFHPEFLEDLRYWAETDRKILLKLLDLVEAVQQDPFVGVGKPEPLRHRASGSWSSKWFSVTRTSSRT